MLLACRVLFAFYVVISEFCDEAGAIQNGKHVSRGTYIGSETVYECNVGYRFANGHKKNLESNRMERTCSNESIEWKKQGTWSMPIPECESACDDLEEFQNVMF